VAYFKTLSCDLREGNEKTHERLYCGRSEVDRHDGGHRGDTVQNDYRVTGNSCRSKSSGTLDRSTDVSKHPSAFTFRVKQFKESCLTLNKRTAILQNAGKSLPDLTVSHSTSLQSSLNSTPVKMPVGLQAGPTWRPANHKKCWISTAPRLTGEVQNFHIKCLELSLAAVQIFTFGVCSFTEDPSFIKWKTILTRNVTG
jgi:hypothetical protein